jgi:hypothetical protein
VAKTSLTAADRLIRQTDTIAAAAAAAFAAQRTVLDRLTDRHAICHPLLERRNRQFHVS